MATSMQDMDLKSNISFSELPLHLFEDSFDGNLEKLIDLEVPNSAAFNEIYYHANSESTSKFPSREEFGGNYEFQLEIDTQYSGKDWLYSSELNKVFVNVMKPIIIKVKSTALGQGFFLRALPVFVGSEHFIEPVIRCLSHSIKTDPENEGYEDKIAHVIRSQHPNTIYQHNPTSRRYSNIVPLESPQPGSDSVLINYVFTCKNSCPGGMNRRPTEIIFTLEDQESNVYGRRCMQVRICSCPKRDKTKEESDRRTLRGKRPMVEVAALPTKNRMMHLEVPADMYPEIAAVIYAQLCVNIQKENRQPTQEERMLIQQYKFTPIELPPEDT